MLLNDILRDTEARIKELQPIVDEASELKAAAEALRKVGAKPSATMTALDMEASNAPRRMKTPTRGPNPGIHRAPKPNGPAGTVIPELANSGASVPAPEATPDRVFNTRYRRGIMRQEPHSANKFTLFTFKRKTDEKSYRVLETGVDEKEALLWLKVPATRQTRKGK